MKVTLALHTDSLIPNLKESFYYTKSTLNKWYSMKGSVLMTFLHITFFLPDSTKSPSRHSDLADYSFNGNGINHRHHIMQGTTDLRHHNHPLLSPQLDNNVMTTESILQRNHGGHHRGVVAGQQQQHPARVSPANSNLAKNALCKYGLC